MMRKKTALILVVVLVLLAGTTMAILQHQHSCDTSNDYFDSHPKTCPISRIVGK